jgi:hypothetical protein
VKWTSWGFLAIIGSLAFLALYLKDREIKAGVDRLYRMQFPRRSALHSPDALPFLYERGSPRLRSDCVLDFQLRLEQEKGLPNLRDLEPVLNWQIPKTFTK